jgi:hypothetical protein
MRGTPVVASGIEYHERHTITADGQVSGRFGKPLEIPEDLVPIPPEPRPTSIDATHPLAPYVSVYRLGSHDEGGRVELQNVLFVDQANSVVVRIDYEAQPDAFGAYPRRSWAEEPVFVVYDEAAIKAENDRRLKKALECAAFYAGVIEAHKDRIDREQEEAKTKAALESMREQGYVPQSDTPPHRPVQ